MILPINLTYNPDEYEQKVKPSGLVIDRDVLMSASFKYILISVLTAVGLFAVYGCHKNPTTYQNTQDNFHLNIEEAKELDTTLVYYWPMGGNTANIDQYSSIQGGVATVMIKDDALELVYETDLIHNGKFTTSWGAEGHWRIIFTIRNFSGTIDFRAQRK